MTYTYSPRVSALMKHSDKLVATSSFYMGKLNFLKDEANSDLTDAKRLARYRRLQSRFHRESLRLCAMADALLATK